MGEISEWAVHRCVSGINAVEMRWKFRNSPFEQFDGGNGVDDYKSPRED